MSYDQIKVGFIGAGQMATALACGFLERQIIASAQLEACDVNESARTNFREKTGVDCTDSISQTVTSVDLVFLAVKPQYLGSVGKEAAPHLKPGQTVVSIAAGVTIDSLREYLGGHQNIIRIMPNTPSLVGTGAAGMAVSEVVPEQQAAIVQGLMESVGLCERLPEKLLDAVTGLSGSGPAYVFQFIEALSDGGVLAGLPRATATRLAAQTVLGAAKMVLETGQHPGQLKDGVTSPGGTTITGISVLESHGFRGAIIEAVHAATDRSRELSGS
ncbi:pyrroline-5-carboxylate reductase [Rubinisphaera margarita]|uniref:pyrroline-5-carboxylate reductase n=1 Tax=Rubinisphaera margarita TaxID=2909586 RepID=UPI001EE8C633|nr:pyrroline-5-carboxylate reductase [Rubinisphaera margarita]MCG6158390.1 pyrroline-5-carboxylate reductase [Rubinisphaera margarita]